MLVPVIDMDYLMQFNKIAQAINSFRFNFEVELKPLKFTAAQIPLLNSLEVASVEPHPNFVI